MTPTPVCSSVSAELFFGCAGVTSNGVCCTVIDVALEGKVTDLTKTMRRQAETAILADP
jgi:hypothetical protein